MRGKLLAFIYPSSVQRITPADAGKTCRKSNFQPAKKDHPRGCGENDVRLRKFDPVPGSPPRMRGKRADVPVQTGAKRITPADAGKTPSLAVFTATEKDHPRGCGENRVQQVRRTKGGGSPPRMRGKLNL